MFTKAFLRVYKYTIYKLIQKKANFSKKIYVFIFLSIMLYNRLCEDKKHKKLK